MASGGKHSLLGNLLLGLLVAGCGLIPLLAAFDLGPLGPGDINGPPWLGLVAGGIFVVAGLVVMAGETAPRLKNLGGIVIICGLAALGNWVAFGAGERLCGGSVSLPWFGNSGTLAGLACRVPFGFGALLLDVLLLAGAARILQQALGGPPRLERLVKVLDGLVLVVLAPLLLILFLGIMARTVGGALKTRLQTGSWPDTQEFLRRKPWLKKRGGPSRKDALGG